MAHALLEANMSDEFPERDRCERFSAPAGGV